MATRSRQVVAATWTDAERQIVLDNFLMTPLEMLDAFPELSRFTNTQISNQKSGLLRFALFFFLYIFITAVVVEILLLKMGLF